MGCTCTYVLTNLFYLKSANELMWLYSSTFDVTAQIVLSLMLEWRQNSITWISYFKDLQKVYSLKINLHEVDSE